MTARFLLFAVFCLSGVFSAAADWPGVPFAEVRAYTYNKKDDDRNIVTKGTLSPTVLNKQGVVLTAEQTRALVAAVTGKRPAPQWAAACFNPHHAFVFYDAAQKPVGWVEVCFECGNAAAEPAQRGQVYDVAALEKLATDLRLPLVPR